MAGSDILDRLFGFWDIPSLSPYAYWQQFTGLVSPYGANPLNINPLRELLTGLVDFEAVARCRTPQLFLSATNVRDGKIRVFTGDEITADAVMASAALPYMFHAVEIGEEAYWDGGYMGNPALFPFFDANDCDDIVLIQVNPIRREAIPRTAPEIMERVSEITFNASILREFRAIDFVNRLHDEHRLEGARYRRNRLHRIDATKALKGRSASTKLDTSWEFFEELRDAGRDAAFAWLETHFAAIGERATLDLRALFS